MVSSSFISFLIASVLLTMAPGPDVMYLLAVSIRSGARAGIALAAGLVSGITFHTALVIFGVAALIRESPFAFSMLKYVGALYILWLAISAFRSKGELKESKAGAAKDYFSIFRRGILMNVLNPKVLLFFLAFLPQFIENPEGSACVEIAKLGLTFAVQGFIIFSAIAIFAGKLREKIFRRKNFGLIMSRTESTVLLLIAAALVF